MPKELNYEEGIKIKRVKYSEYVRRDAKGNVIYNHYLHGSTLKLEEKGEALFHQWGTNYEEFETGPGNYSTAIIELPNGKVMNIPAENIRFITD